LTQQMAMCTLLIVPEGIEINYTYSVGDLFQLLIVPEGIEIDSPTRWR